MIVIIIIDIDILYILYRIITIFAIYKCFFINQKFEKSDKFLVIFKILIIYLQCFLFNDLHSRGYMYIYFLYNLSNNIDNLQILILKKLLIY